MPELLRTYVVRNAEQLPQSYVMSVGVQSHPSSLQSQRYTRWSGLSAERRYREVEALMRKFLEGEEAIRSTQQIPAALRKPIEFAEYNGYKFDKNEFMRQFDVEQLSREFGERDRDGRYSDDSNFKKVYSGLADALIAKTRISDPRFQSAFDEQAALKTLSLVERAYAGRNIQLDMNIDSWYGSPLVLDGILLEMDFCWDVDYTPPPEDVAGGVVRGKCECKCNTNCVQQNPCCPKITPYVADLYVVKDYLRCYEVGEMSYIENVIQSEVRERKHRTLEREEFVTERTEEISSFDEKDHQVDEKFSLEKEIESTVKQELSLDTGVTFNYRWGTGDLKMTTDIGYNLTKQDAQKSAQKSAKEIMNKAISRLETKVREFSSRKFFRESEETNKHVFGGTDGAPNDISRQFYYVNSLRRAQVYNYGRRMLLDIYVPEPSELYKRLVKKQFTLTKPVKPAVTPKQITEENYLTYVETYGLTDVEPPPAPASSASYSFSGGTGEPKQAIDIKYTWFGAPYPVVVWNGSGSDVKPDTVVVPNGYRLESMTTSFGDVHFNGHGVNSSLAVDLAGQNLFVDSNGGSRQSVQFPASPPADGAQAITASSMNTTDYKLLVVVHYKLKDEERLKWQTGIYDKIMKGYQQQLADYEAALAKFEEGGERVNPFLLLEDIREQLKQATISYISCQFYDSMNAMRQKVEPCGFPQPDLQEAKKEGEFVRFFEQAFEWKFMNFVLYPYFWGRKCSWEEKKKQESDNLLFQRFLQAGYAGVSISVRPGFEGHVNYFLKTKQIWGKTGQPPVAGPDFVPIYQEIKEDKDNFNTDRDGKINVTNGLDVVTLNGTDQYWNYGNPSANPPIAGFPDPNKIAADIDREIFIDCKQYRIVDIQFLSINSWKIILDRPYEGVDAIDLPWSTGALFIGAPWEFRIPTRLVWLREDARCLPCYPIECEE